MPNGTVNHNRQGVARASFFNGPSGRNVTLAIVDSIKERCLQWIGRQHESHNLYVLTEVMKVKDV